MSVSLPPGLRTGDAGAVCPLEMIPCPVCLPGGVGKSQHIWEIPHPLSNQAHMLLPALCTWGPMGVYGTLR